MNRQATILEKLAALIPGYTGYIDRESRRTCDKKVRVEVSKELANCERTLQNRIAAEIAKTQLYTISGLENARKRLNTLSSTIMYAPYGVSSFFSENQLNKPELNAIFLKDLHLLKKVRILHSNIHKMEQEHIHYAVDDLEALLQSRDAFLQEHK